MTAMIVINWLFNQVPRQRAGDHGLPRGEQRDLRSATSTDVRRRRLRPPALAAGVTWGVMALVLVIVGGLGTSRGPAASGRAGPVPEPAGTPALRPPHERSDHVHAALIAPEVGGLLAAVLFVTSTVIDLVARCRAPIPLPATTSTKPRWPWPSRRHQRGVGLPAAPPTGRFAALQSSVQRWPARLFVVGVLSLINLIQGDRALVEVGRWPRWSCWSARPCSASWS